MPMTISRRIMLTLTLIMTLSACGDSPVSPGDVKEVTWMLTSLQEAGSAAVTVADPSRYRLTFGDNGNVAVRSDCNSCSGPYTLSGSTITISAMACTRAFCGDASLDSRFTEALQKAGTISMDGEQLVVRGGGSVLRFRR